MERFDLLTSNLSGRHLIESNAGTGKTYVIAALYVRLLLERELEVKQILVVTFTEAATEDLKRRIRETIVQSVRTFTDGNPSDSFLLGLLGKEKDRARAKAILEMALQTLDEASVFTIHGFCHRALQDSAFESSALFDAQFATSQEKVLREIIDDFWRNELYSDSSLFSEYLRNLRLSPEELYKFASRSLCIPFLKTAPGPQRPDSLLVARAESELANSYNELAGAWRKARSEIREVLLNSDVLNRNLY